MYIKVMFEAGKLNLFNISAYNQSGELQRKSFAFYPIK